MKTYLAEIVIEELDKFPNTPTLTLAKKIYKENPEVAKSIEHIRSTIRYYRGQMGDKSREQRINREGKKLFKEGKFNPFNIPNSDADDNDPYILPKQITRLLVLADTHIPYHDVEAMNVALDYGKKKKVNGILLNGDIIDFYRLSRFDKDPRMRDFAGEIGMMNEFLAILNKTFKCPIYYKLGNHEERYEAYLRVKAPELLGVSAYEIENVLNFHRYNTHIIRDQRVVKIGKLHIVHGHEFQSKAVGQVNPARSIFLKTKKNTLVAHSHRSSMHSEPNIDSKVITTWSQGCLCGLAPEYARLNFWNHGFAYVEMTDEENFVMHNKRIYKGNML